MRSARDFRRAAAAAVAAVLAIAVPAPAQTPGTLYVQQELLDDCPNGCLIYTGARKLWRVPLASAVPRFRALIANSDPSPAMPISVAPQGDMLLSADQDRRLTVTPVSLARMAFTGPGVRIAGPRPTGPLGEYLIGGPDPTVQLSAAWSPDGMQIAFAGQVHQRTGIWLAGRDGAGWRQLPCACEAFGSSLDWSVTGVLAFDGGSGRSAIWAVNADGSARRRLTAPPKGHGDFTATWSPDATRLAFVRGSDEDDSRLEVLDLRTGLLRAIAKSAQNPAWSPDGTELAYIGSDDSIHVVSDTGAPVRRLALPEYLTSHGYLVGLSWRSADDASADVPAGPLVVYSSLALTGAGSQDGNRILRGEQLALADAGGAVDGRPVVLQVRSNTARRARSFSYPLTWANALRAAEDANAVGYIGEDDSYASQTSMPILNQAGLAQVSPSNRYGGLTRADATDDYEEPGEYFPSGSRTYARVLPADFVIVRAVADLAARGCPRRAWLVDTDDYFLPPPERRIAPRRLAALGVRVVGHSILAKPAQATRIARQIHRRRADCLVFIGDPSADAVSLWKRIHETDPRVRFYAGGPEDPAFTRRITRGAAKRTLLVMRELPADALGPAAAAVAQRYEATYRQPASLVALAGYESMSLVLDAIHRAGVAPNRDSVRDALFATRDRASILGNYTITPSGDSTLNRVGVYRIGPAGKLVFDTADVAQ